MPWRGKTFPGLDWGVAYSSKKGEAQSGDAYIIRTVPAGVLVAVVDGLGHGVEAHDAADRVVRLIERSVDVDVPELMRRCYQVLLGTRGVVMSIAEFNIAEDTLTWIGVGNVTGSLLRANGETEPAREGLLTRGGVVGLQLPSIHPTVKTLARGDVLVLATDGLHPGLADHLSVEAPLQEIADELLDAHSSGTDDALIFIGRFMGRARG